MGRYLLRRLLQVIPVLFGTTFLVYVVVWRIPGDPFAGRCGDRACPEAYINAMHEQFRLNEPLLVQYGHYIANMLQGDLGLTYNMVPVSDLIAQATPITIRLALVALAFEIVIGVVAGVIAGLRRNSFFDNLVFVSTLLALSVPVFVLGRFLQWLLGVQWGIITPTVSGDATWGELIVPGIVIATTTTAVLARLARTTIAENLRADYVRTAIAKGLPRRRVIGVHLLRNSLIPIVTLIGLDLGTLMVGAVVTEGIFNINGLGGLVYRHVLRLDATVVVPVATLFVLIYIIANLVVDLLYGVLDPRIRYE
ncbi:ABC transporter permease [Spiractinospora alimapuensis]|uniref:ABC transporter permease n=1 Tax=Spiractinospora alimapuensis TaxID=2820884 RepID=UPI001F3A8DA7|nr:ABC transporter permease [Spiractinospora alimapuensis]QVQ53919.1 ABC transporter permease [Spiractinospora alimapuensis]